MLSKVNNVCLDCGKIFQAYYAKAYCKECEQKRGLIKGKSTVKYPLKEVIERANKDGLSYGYEVAKIEGRLNGQILDAFNDYVNA